MAQPFFHDRHVTRSQSLSGNTTLIIMDEPSEGLAPAIVEHLIETCHKLVEEGQAILLVEQT